VEPKYVGHKTRPGWKGTLPFYQFTCKTHGLVENYPQGHHNVLRCPKCVEEAINKEKTDTENHALKPEPPIKELRV